MQRTMSDLEREADALEREMEALDTEVDRNIDKLHGNLERQGDAFRIEMHSFFADNSDRAGSGRELGQLGQVIETSCSLCLAITRFTAAAVRFPMDITIGLLNVTIEALKRVTPDTNRHDHRP